MKTLVQLSTRAHTVLLVIGFSTQLLGQPCGEISPGAVAWWRGESNGLDSAGTHHGTPRNGAAFASGRVGQAFSLDGTDDYLEVPDSPALNFGTGDFTASCWVNFNATTGEQILMEKFVGPNGPGWTFAKLYANQLHLYIDGGATALTSPPRPISTGVWHHFAARRRGGTGALFMNGQLVFSDTAAGSGSSSSSFKIGRRDNDAAYLNGLMDEVTLYNRALADAEIQAIHAACALRLALRRSDHGPAPVSLTITGVPGNYYLIQRAERLPGSITEGWAGFPSYDQWLPHLLRRVDPAGGATLTLMDPVASQGFFVATEYAGPVDPVILLQRELPADPTQHFRVAWVFTHDAPGRQQMIRLRAPGNLSLTADNLLGAAPATGLDYFLTEAGQWSTSETFISGFGGVLTNQLPESTSGRWQLEIRLRDPATGDTTGLTQLPFVVSSAPGIYLNLSRAIANSSDVVHATVALGAAQPQAVRLAAWLVQPDGSQVGLPNFEPGLQVLHEGPSIRRTWRLFRRTFPTPGTYRLEARLWNAAGQVIGLGRREFEICNGPPQSLTGTVHDSAGNQLGDGASLAQVTAFDLDDGDAVSVAIDTAGSFSLALQPGRYQLNASVFDGAGFHQTTNVNFVDLRCGGDGGSLNLTSAPAYGPPARPGLARAKAPVARRAVRQSVDCPKPRVFVAGRTNSIDNAIAAIFTSKLVQAEPELAILSTADLPALLHVNAFLQALGADQHVSIDPQWVNGSTSSGFVIKLDYTVVSSLHHVLTAELYDTRDGTLLRSVQGTTFSGTGILVEMVNMTFEQMEVLLTDPPGRRALLDLLRTRGEEPCRPFVSAGVSSAVVAPHASVTVTAGLREENAAGRVQPQQPITIDVTRPDGTTTSARVTTGASGQATLVFDSGMEPPSGARPGQLVARYYRRGQLIAESEPVPFRVQPTNSPGLSLTSPLAQVGTNIPARIIVSLTPTAGGSGPAVTNVVVTLNAANAMIASAGQIPVQSALQVVTAPGAGSQGTAEVTLLAGSQSSLAMVAASCTVSNYSGGIANTRTLNASILFALDAGIQMLTYATPTNTLAGLLSRVIVESQVDGARLPGLPVSYSLNGPGTLTNAVNSTDLGGRSEVTFIAPVTAPGTSVISAVLTFGQRNYTNTATVTWESFPTCLEITNAITGWWPGDSMTTDVVGGRHAFLRGGAGYEPGLVQGSFSLNGNKQFVEVPHDSAMNVGTGDFTFEVWVRFNIVAGEQVIAEKYVERFDTTKSGWTLTMIGGGLRWALSHCDHLDSPLAHHGGVGPLDAPGHPAPRDQLHGVSGRRHDRIPQRRVRPGHAFVAQIRPSGESHRHARLDRHPGVLAERRD